MSNSIVNYFRERAGTTPIAPASEVALKTSYKSIAGVTLLFTVFIFAGCGDNNNKKDIKPSERKEFGVTLKLIDLENQTEFKCAGHLQDVKAFRACKYQVRNYIDEKYKKLDEKFSRAKGGRKDET